MSIFHAHIYFEPNTRESASALREKAEIELKQKILNISRLIDRPIGPHPKPMFEIDFKEEDLGALYIWLREHHGPHSVLIHKNVSPEIPEHTIFATWIGTCLPLDLSKLDIDGNVNAQIMRS